MGEGKEEQERSTSPLEKNVDKKTISFTRLLKISHQ